MKVSVLRAKWRNESIKRGVRIGLIVAVFIGLYAITGYNALI